MTSARAKHAGGMREGYGMVIFASVLLLVVGFFNLIDGIVAIAKSHFFVGNAHYVVGDLRSWGWTVLILGALQVLVAAGVVTGNQAARWTAVVLIGLSAIAQMMFLPSYPLWSLMIIAVDVVALYGLCAYGSRENIAG